MVHGVSRRRRAEMERNPDAFNKNLVVRKERRWAKKEIEPEEEGELFLWECNESMGMGILKERCNPPAKEPSIIDEAELIRKIMKR